MPNKVTRDAPSSVIVAPAPSATIDPEKLKQANAILDKARFDAANDIKSGKSEGRKLSSYGTLCSQCKAGATTKAVGEALLCGTAALGAEVVTAGLTTSLDFVGFAACEATSLVEFEANCAS